MTWLPALGALATVLAALIAGTFAFYRLRRSLAAQRALEEEKAAAQRALERERIVTSSRESELTELRAARREYQQSRVLPFLEQLNKALIESYATVAFPPYFRDLAAHIPQTRGYADKAINEWLGATEQMSRYRMQLLLVLSEEMIPPVTSLLTEFMDLTRQLIRTRDEV